MTTFEFKLVQILFIAKFIYSVKTFMPVVLLVNALVYLYCVFALNLTVQRYKSDN